MTRLKAMGIALAVTLVLSATVASAALAQPEFSKSGVKFTGTSGPSVISGALTCKKDSVVKGEIGKTLVTAVVLFEECAKPCPSTVGLETTGELGSVAVGEAASGRGVLMKTGWTFTCGTTEFKITGSVAGEITPTSSSTGHELIFALSGGAQKIKSITVPGGLVHPELKVNGFGPATYESIEKDTFTEAISIS